MVYLIIINWFYRSFICIYNRSIVRFNWKIWRVNLNITIINGTIIKSTHDSWNHRTGFGRRITVFEVSCWRLAVPLSWWISWFLTMKGVELINIYSKTWLEESRATDDSGISLVYNSSTQFTNNLLSHAESCNNCLESCCKIVDGIRRNKITREMTWSGQCLWSSNNL